jgi:ABC-type glycerol-3-phosphate transport system substrate-binding protein
MSRRKALVCLLLFSAALVFAQKPLTLRFSSWLGMEAASKEAIETMVKMFEAKYPLVKVELIGIPYEQTQQQTFVAVAGGNAPDVIHLVAQWGPPLASMGALVDLKGFYSQAEMDDIPRAALQAGMFKEMLATVPWQLGSIAVMGWKSVLARAGLKAQVPETWPEFKDAVRQASKASEGVYGFGARTSKDANSAYWLFPVMWGHGGEFEDAQGKIVFNNPGTVAALEWYREIGASKQSPVGMTVREVRNLMPQGKLAYIFDGPWMKGIFRSLSGLGEAVDDDYLLGLFPKAADGKRYGIGNDHVLSVSTQSKLKKEAVQLVKFLTQDEAVTKMYYAKNGAVPTYKKLLADPLYSSDPYARTFIESAEFANSVPSKNPNFSAALEFVANAMQQSLLGGDPAKAAEAAAQSIKTLYKQ